MLTALEASRYKHTRKGQVFLFVLGCAAGCRLLWNLNKANWLVNMQQVSISLHQLLAALMLP